MDNFSFAAGIGATILSDKLETARQQAAAAVERAQSNAAYAAEKAQEAAVNMQATAVSIDVTKVASNVSMANVQSLAESSCTRLRDSAAVAASTVERVASGASLRGIGSPSGAGGSGAVGGTREAARGAHGKEMEENSDSGGDDSSWSAASVRDTFASRLGFGGHTAEQMSLLPRSQAGAQGSDTGRGGGGWGGGLAELGLKQVRETASAGLATANGLGGMVGSGLGLVAAKPREPEGVLGRLCMRCPTLSKGQRLVGFAVCFTFGCLLSLSALGSLPSLLIGNPAPFAFKYTFGNLLALGSSSFLVGPQRQIQDMLAADRRMVSCAYTGSLLATLLCVFVLKSQLLSLFFVVVQFAALTWYMLSYVPYGQQCLRSLLARLTK